MQKNIKENPFFEIIAVKGKIKKLKYRSQVQHIALTFIMDQNDIFIYLQIIEYNIKYTHRYSNQNYLLYQQINQFDVLIQNYIGINLILNWSYPYYLTLMITLINIINSKHIEMNIDNRQSNSNILYNSSMRQQPSRNPTLAGHDNRSTQQIQAENQQLMEAIRKLKQERLSKAQREFEEVQPSKNHDEFNRRTQINNNKIEELQMLIKSQHQTINGYKQRFREFEGNLSNIMKLDKDIHTKLVNPQTSASLDSNVRNVLMALNGKAPYDKLLKMIQSIKI